MAKFCGRINLKILGLPITSLLSRVTFQMISQQMDVGFGFSSTRANTWYVGPPKWHWSCCWRQGLLIYQSDYSWRFCKGTNGLARHDFHFIRRGRDNVMSLSAVDKQGWLRGIQLARDSRITAPPAHRQQQQLMQDFFHTADNWVLHSPTTGSFVPSPSITQWILSIIRLWWWCAHTVKCGSIKWEVVLWVAPFFFFHVFIHRYKLASHIGFEYWEPSNLKFLHRKWQFKC
jgi:hypothetical protein